MYLNLQDIFLLIITDLCHVSLRLLVQLKHYSYIFMTFPSQVRGTKGPIFEDGPNFDMAFRLFHGHDGVVPLSGRSFVHSENVGPESTPSQFNPLAAKAATISLSSFGLGGPFGFDSFSEKWKNQKRKSNSSKKEPSSKVIYPQLFKLCFSYSILLYKFKTRSKVLFLTNFMQTPNTVKFQFSELRISSAY